MKRFIITFLVFAAMISSAYSQTGQVGYSFGITAAYNRSVHNSQIQTIPGNHIAPFFTKGAGNGYSLGLSFEAPIPGPLSDLALICRINYESLPIHGDIDGKTYQKLLFDTQGRDTTYYLSYRSTRWIYDLKSNVISAEGLFRFNLFKSHLGITFGPFFRYILNTNFKESFSLVEPVNAQFLIGEWDSLGLGREPLRYENNDRAMVFEDGPLKDINNFRIGLAFGVQYEILFPGIKIIPFATYNFDMLDLKDKWSMNAFKAGLDARILF